jgi:hypothetical protein
MRRLLLLPAILLLALLHPHEATAQQADETVSFTGCLAQKTDDSGTHYVLTNVAGKEVPGTEIELTAGEGVDLATHVGHTVKATGMVAADKDEDDAEMAEMAAADEGAVAEEAMHVVVKVAKLSHVSASCDSK